MKQKSDILDAVCTALDVMPIDALHSGSEERLRKFRSLCRHWEQLVTAEMETRKKAPS
jgi:hypothetical protein